jgi:hypothetical protein
MNTSGIEYSMFKKVANGYIFRAPAFWLFGAGRHYLVNDAQKAEITQILKLKQPERPLRFGLFLGVFLVILTMAWAYFGYRDHDPGIGDYLLLIVLAFAAIIILLQVFTWVKLYRLKPVLVHLQRSEEGISHSELRAAMQASPSLKGTISHGAAQALVFAPFRPNFWAKG